MRVLQLIDSLHPGGAERMAVTLANALHTKTDGSFICVTREEGILKEELKAAISYLFLNKNKKVDIRAIKKLREYCIKNKISHVHAHGTSFFIATQLKMVLPQMKLVWHEHYGSRIKSTGSQNKVLRFCSGYFDQIITVTPELKSWSEQYLKCSRVTYVSNFVNVSSFNGNYKRENRIICLANLKQPKNHMLLLKAFAAISSDFLSWDLALVGKVFNDDYYKELVGFTEVNNIQNKVHFLGGDTNVKNELLISKIGVLSSSYEGLPIALIEYGAAGLAPLTTDVGSCKEVIGSFGEVIPLGETELYINSLRTYLSDQNKLEEDAWKFKQHVEENYSEAAVIPRFINIYKAI